jgi:hypothetical protein
MSGRGTRAIVCLDEDGVLGVVLLFLVVVFWLGVLLAFWCLYQWLLFCVFSLGLYCTSFGLIGISCAFYFL